LSIDARALTIAIALCLVSADGVGGAAAWRLVRAGTQRLLHGSPQRFARSVVSQEIFLAVQVAFAVILLTGATEMARGYSATLAVDPGFDTSSTQTVQLTLPAR
jgi:hypothetical protein